MSGSNCCFLTCIQISQEASKVVWYSHLFKNFPQSAVIHTVKGFSIANEEEVDVFLEFFCFFYDPKDVGNLISGSSAFSKSSLNIWNFLVHVSYDFSRTLIWMWELDHKEVWEPKNLYFQTVVLVVTPESPLDSKEIKPVNPKGYQPWIFNGRIDIEAETPILWPCDGKS